MLESMHAGTRHTGRIPDDFKSLDTDVSLEPPERSSDEDIAALEKELPNTVRMLEATDGDGRFDKSTLLADKMTYPMGGAWHDGALYVASPPNIWRLEDTTGDGIADRREILVSQFGYTGNAASTVSYTHLTLPTNREV